MVETAERDYFTDFGVLREPYAYFEAIREHGPVYRPEGRDMLIVSGFKEAAAILRDTDNYSSAIAPQGPTIALPFATTEADISAEIEAHRPEFMGGELVVACDGRRHANSRAILNRLFTPSRLRANEAYMTKLADEMVRTAVAKRRFEVMGEIATRYVTLVIADLLAIPADDREVFMEVIAAGPPAGNMEAGDKPFQPSSLEFMGKYFAEYVAARRAEPRDDVLSELANTTFPDGSHPDLLEIVRLATFLFAAGQDTSAKLLGNALRYLVDVPGLQDRLRSSPDQIDAFVEEILRLEGSTKITSRVARKDTSIGDIPVPVGTRVMIALAAANRDPQRWPEPTEVVIGREKIKEHLAFGRGAHVCVGAPLARVEVRVMLERLLAHTSDIAISEEIHGPADARVLEYEPSFIIRGLEVLHLEVVPA